MATYDLTIRNRHRYVGALHRAGEASGAITLLVSHRFSTVGLADLIVVLDEGRASASAANMRS